MNIDTGEIRYWTTLTQEEKDSGRWVKLGEGELARAERIERHERKNRLNEIFGTQQNYKGPSRGFHK